VLKSPKLRIIILFHGKDSMQSVNVLLLSQSKRLQQYFRVIHNSSEFIITFSENLK